MNLPFCLWNKVCERNCKHPGHLVESKSNQLLATCVCHTQEKILYSTAHSFLLILCLYQCLVALTFRKCQVQGDKALADSLEGVRCICPGPSPSELLSGCCSALRYSPLLLQCRPWLPPCPAGHWMPLQVIANIQLRLDMAKSHDTLKTHNLKYCKIYVQIFLQILILWVSVFYSQNTVSVWCLFHVYVLYQPNKKPATFQRGKSAVGRTLFSARISLNFSRCFFSWSHIS